MSCGRGPGSPLEISRAGKKESKVTLCPVLSWPVLVSKVCNEGITWHLGKDQGCCALSSFSLPLSSTYHVPNAGRYWSLSQKSLGYSWGSLKGNLRQGKSLLEQLIPCCPFANPPAVSPFYPPILVPLLSFQFFFLDFFQKVFFDQILADWHLNIKSRVWVPHAYSKTYKHTRCCEENRIDDRHF